VSRSLPHQGFAQGSHADELGCHALRFPGGLLMNSPRASPVFDRSLGHSIVSWWPVGVYMNSSPHGVAE
jgi:hypothetical protein